MAMGDTYSRNTDNNRKDNSPQVYSPLAFRNPTAVTDPSEISFGFWKNLLKITISPKLENQNAADKMNHYDHENNTSIYLNWAKAKMLHDEIEAMLENPGTVHSAGVPSGSSGLISFSDGIEYGVDGYMLVITKLDQEGNLLNSYSYQFNQKDFYYAVRNFNQAKGTYDSKYYEMIEIERFLLLLENFYRAQDYAMAYTVIDASKFDNTRLNTKVELIMDKLGIERKGFKTTSSQKSYFNSPKQENSYEAAPKNQTSIESLASQLELE